MNLIPREMWGARPARDPYEPDSYDALVVHHTSSPPASAYSGAETIRIIQTFHQETRGWSDIGYHFLIGPDGALYQGRPEGTLGAHSPPNVGRLGVCAIGNFEGVETVTEAQMRTLIELLGHFSQKYAIPAERIFGHRDFQKTTCPGSTFYAQLPAIRVAMGQLSPPAREASAG